MASAYKVVVFDAYGTLFDVYSIGALAENLYPGHGAALANLWRDKQIEYTRLISLSDPSLEGSRYYQSFWEITRASLRYSLEALKLAHSQVNEDALMGQYAKLTAFPENKAVLEALKAKGIPAAILSNGSSDMLASAVASAGFTILLDKVISIETVKHFKTTPQSYQLVLDAYDVEPKEVLFVSSNAWDALGATWFGFTTMWINRKGMPFEAMGPRPAFVGSSLKAVLESFST